MPEQQKNLWAPWRMEYLQSLTGEDASCFLCAAIENPGADRANLVLQRDAHTLVLLNRFPYSSGHVLIAPVQHAGSLEALDDAAMLALMHRTRDAQRILQAAVRAQGFNVGINVGRCAGAGLPDHLHVHVVPRWSGDTNYMPVVADVKVIPQALETVREAYLRAAAELAI
jgi:ATP adenylyltransferase